MKAIGDEKTMDRLEAYTSLRLTYEDFWKNSRTMR